MEKETFQVSHKDGNIVGDLMPVGSTPKILCLHGGGNSTRKRYDYLRELLAGKNIPSCAFDFWGHGETGGRIEESSLRDRTEQAQEVVKQLKVINPLIILGSSMSAYTAIKLTEIYPVSLLILTVPAVYARELYKVPFGNQFSELVRKKESWRETDAWKIINKFKGKIMIVEAGKDDVIPKEVVQKIYDSAENALSREILTFPDAPHKIMATYFNDHPSDIQKFVDKVIKLINP